jgi:hypothetical protein
MPQYKSSIEEKPHVDEQEEQEITIILFTNTLIEPYTVVIKG